MKSMCLLNQAKDVVFIYCSVNHMALKLPKNCTQVAITQHRGSNCIWNSFACGIKMKNTIVQQKARRCITDVNNQHRKALRNQTNRLIIQHENNTLDLFSFKIFFFKVWLPINYARVIIITII